MTILDLGTMSRTLRRSHRAAGGRREPRPVAVRHPPLALRGPEPSAHAGSAILDLALCLILAATVVGLLLLAL